LNRSPNECSIKTRFGSTCARLLVDVPRTIAIVSATTTSNAKKQRRSEGIRQERMPVRPTDFAL